jgi:hypothetical protein
VYKVRERDACMAYKNSRIAWLLNDRRILRFILIFCQPYFTPYYIESLQATAMSQEGEASTSYRQPSKHILSPAHLAAFRRSTTHDEITEFISDLNSSIIGKTLNDVGPASNVSISYVAELMSSASNH